MILFAFVIMSQSITTVTSEVDVHLLLAIVKDDLIC